MHVIDFIFPEDHYAKSHSKQNVTNDKSASHHRISCLQAVPKFLSSKHFWVHLYREKHHENKEDENTASQKAELGYL